MSPIDDPIRRDALAYNIESSKKHIGDAIVQAYSVVVTLSDKNEVQAFKVPSSDESLFARIKAAAASRIQDTAISSDALLPDGPYDLWKEGDTSRRVKDLVGAFAQFPHLPKMLNRRAILDTLFLGCREGQFVLRVTRPDRTTRTYWREEPSEADAKDPSLEVVLPEAASISEISPGYLEPGGLPGLWSGKALMVGDIEGYFSGKRTVKIQRDGYDEPLTIPRADPITVRRSVSEAVRLGKLWLTSGPASVLGEDVPEGLMTVQAMLQAAPVPVPLSDLLPISVPAAWEGKIATASALASELSKKVGLNLPWTTIRSAIEAAVRSRMFEPTADSAAWPCDFAAAKTVRFQQVTTKPIDAPPVPPVQPPGVLTAEAELKLNEIQNLAEQLSELKRVAAGADLKFVVRVVVDFKGKPAPDRAAKLDEVLAQVSPRLKIQP